MIINSANLQGLRVTFSAAFNKALETMTTQKEKIATTIPSTSKLNTYGWLGDFPQMKEWIGEREIQNLSEKAYNIMNKHFEMTVGVNRDDIEDDNLGMYTLQMQQMGQSAKEHQDILAIGMLPGGFKGLAYDDKPFFATDHAIGDKTYSNKGTAKLSADSYGAARASMASIRNERGTALNIKPCLLVVPPSLEAEGRKILTAELIDGTTNPWKGSAELLVDANVVNDEHPDNWFLLDTSKAIKPVIFQLRKNTKFVSLVNENDTNVFSKNQYLYGADGRYNTGYSYWQLAYGSTGEVSG